MDTLSVGPSNPVAVGVLNTPEPVIQPVAGGLAHNGKASGTPTVTLQDLAQSLFQRNLQAATLYPATEPASGSEGLAQDAIASLLAALNPARAAANANPPAAPAANPEATQAVTTPASVPAASTIPTSATQAATAQDLPTTQDAFGTSLNPDFAMQTALRFGAGVTIQAATAAATPSEGTGLVRDATAVLRMGNLQPHAGSPGPEAFAHPRTTTQQVLRTYAAVPAPAPALSAGSVDLIA
jgi:hypothetical protein